MFTIYLEETKIPGRTLKDNSQKTLKFKKFNPTQMALVFKKFNPTQKIEIQIKPTISFSSIRLVKIKQLTNALSWQSHGEGGLATKLLV